MDLISSIRVKNTQASGLFQVSKNQAKNANHPVVIKHPNMQQQACNSNMCIQGTWSQSNPREEYQGTFARAFCREWPMKCNCLNLLHQNLSSDKGPWGTVAALLI